IAVIHRDAIDLSNRNVVHADVGYAHVEAFVQTAVADDIDMAGVCRIHANHVMVGLAADVVSRRGRLLREGRAAVLALDDLGAWKPDALVIVGIDGRLAVIHRPRIRAAHLLPGGAGVFGTIGTTRRSVLDGGDQQVGFRAR